MKKSLLALAAAGMLCCCGSANADVPATSQTPVAAPAPVVVSAPARRTRTYRTSRRGGLLQSIIELERRKNAWLRRSLLGR